MELFQTIQLPDVGAIDSDELEDINLKLS